MVELLAAPEVAALVGDRVYPVELPGEPELPAMAYQVVDEKRHQAARRPTGGVRSLVQLSIVAPDYDAAYAVAWVVRRRLARWRGVAGGVLIYDTLEESSQDAGESTPHMVAMTWRIYWKEA
ncbi:hypothetical protein BI344_08590 [Chromobacterium sphagni]|uniref:DUF3168 domain-containing protein n=1 Tax=Chromobacterium sphagni TaxID=1903179 RepID=A0ABX3CDX0_9NEIS|nr:hypothetical protein BI344_08590 [Chromobacterium sphagni]